MAGGRPSDFKPELANEICERLMRGESLRAICSDDEAGWLPHERTVYRWLEANEAFRQQYAHAREAQADRFVDEIIEIADSPNVTTNRQTGEAEMRDPQRDRLRVDARKWVASKLAPKKYGEKLAIGGDPDAPPVKAELTVKFVGD